MSTLDIGEEAARWLAELQDADRKRQAELLTWLRASPRHVEEFLFATTVWKKLQKFGESHARRVEELIVQAAAEDSNVIDMLPRSREAGRRTLLRTMAWAAGLAAVALAATWWLALRAPAYSTAIGEQRIVRLDDGSVVYLNTHSKVQVAYSKETRLVRLLEGEALFTVQQDGRRPFRVEAGSSTIQALGTQFNVYRQTAGTTVSVIEGSVAVTATILKAGEQARIASNGAVVKRRAPDVVKAVAWRERRLVFRSDRLADVAAEVNRYSPRPIRIEGDEARNLRLTAIFDADDPDSLLRFLQKLDGLSIQRAGDAVTVRPSSPPRTSPPRSAPSSAGRGTS